MRSKQIMALTPSFVVYFARSRVACFVLVTFATRLLSRIALAVRMCNSHGCPAARRCSQRLFRVGFRAFALHKAL